MRLEKRRIDIIVPMGSTSPLAGPLALCELFISSLLGAAERPIDVKVELPSRTILCRSERVRETLRLIVGAKATESFASQMASLLHPASGVELNGILVFDESGVRRRFEFRTIGDAHIDWRITELED